MSQVETNEKNKNRLVKSREEMDHEFFDKFKKKTQKRLREVNDAIVVYKRAVNLARAKNRNLVIKRKVR